MSRSSVDGLEKMGDRRAFAGLWARFRGRGAFGLGLWLACALSTPCGAREGYRGASGGSCGSVWRFRRSQGHRGARRLLAPCREFTVISGVSAYPAESPS